MKQFISFTVSIIICSICVGQTINLDRFNKQRVKIAKTGMAVLGAWGAANVIYNGVSINSTNGSDKYFYQMNLICGGVNLSLGTVGYLLSKDHNGLGYTQTLKKQMNLEKLFLFNTGLDAAYIIGGFYFKERTGNDNTNHYRNKGYGESIILQGSALFLFDGIMYLMNNRNGKKLYKLSEKIQAGISFNRISCLVKL